MIIKLIFHSDWRTIPTNNWFFFVIDPQSVLGRGKLTERLLAQGILTPTMLNELKKEWNKKPETESDNETPTKPSSRRKRKSK